MLDPAIPVIYQLIVGAAIGVVTITVCLIAGWALAVAWAFLTRKEHPEGICSCMVCYTFFRSKP